MDLCVFFLATGVRVAGRGEDAGYEFAAKSLNHVAWKIGRVSSEHGFNPVNL